MHVIAKTHKNLALVTPTVHANNDALQSKRKTTTKMHSARAQGAKTEESARRKFEDDYTGDAGTW